MTSWWILIVIIGFSRRATCNYHCTMQSSEVACSGINVDQLSQNVSVVLNKIDIVSLNLTNGIISTISPSTFKDFNSLQSLYVTNCKVSNLEDNSISHSLDLTHLYLNNNTLTKFNVRALPLENGLSFLDLSYNHLNDLSDFNVSYFPNLKMLNLANNYLSYLPVNLLVKLEEQNQFYLVADNNPWNCNDSNWSEYLTDHLINAFCLNHNNFNYIPNGNTEITTKVPEISTLDKGDIRTERNADIPFFKIQDFESGDNFDNGTELQTLDEDKNNNTKTIRKKEIPCEKNSCATCSFRYCIYWFLGGIWIGIILGNIPKIKNLVCARQVEYVDQSTQCDNFISEHYMVSGFRLDFNLKQQRDT